MDHRCRQGGNSATNVFRGSLTTWFCRKKRTIRRFWQGLLGGWVVFCIASPDLGLGGGIGAARYVREMVGI